MVQIATLLRYNTQLGICKIAKRGILASGGTETCIEDLKPSSHSIISRSPSLGDNHGDQPPRPR